MEVKPLYTVEECLTINGGIIPLAKSTVYSMIRKGLIPHKKLGRRVFIKRSYIEELLN